MLVQLLAQGYDGVTLGVMALEANLLILGPDHSCLGKSYVLCLEEENVSEPEQRLTPLYQLPQSNTSSRT